MHRADPLLAEIHQPDSVAELAERVRSAYESRTALYPIGGGTCLDHGLPISPAGQGIDVTRLNAVIDYPSADMTITTQAGIRMAELQRVLSEHRQTLPLDIPLAEQATLGGVIATNFSGPRRAGYGTARDYVIGIRAVDGRGMIFSGGGRVVKNVAGYDFCRMLIGSYGTLGIIGEVTLKLKPQATDRGAVIVAPRHSDQLDALLAQLVVSRTQPIAVTWIRGAVWRDIATRQNWPETEDPSGWLALLFEGLPREIEWSIEQIQREWSDLTDGSVAVLQRPAADVLLGELTEFPASDAGWLLKANLRPSETVRFVRLLIDDSPDVQILSHAANGIVIAGLTTVPEAEMTQLILRRWRPAASAAGGNLVVWRRPENTELTRRVVWGNPSGPIALMSRIKTQFDPHGILNPNRFVY